MVEAVVSCSRPVSSTSPILESCRTSRALGGGRGVAFVSSGPRALGGVVGSPVGVGGGEGCSSLRCSEGRPPGLGQLLARRDRALLEG